MKSSEKVEKNIGGREWKPGMKPVDSVDEERMADSVKWIIRMGAALAAMIFSGFALLFKILDERRARAVEKRNNERVQSEKLRKELLQKVTDNEKDAAIKKEAERAAGKEARQALYKLHGKDEYISRAQEIKNKEHKSAADYKSLQEEYRQGKKPVAKSRARGPSL